MDTREAVQNVLGQVTAITSMQFVVSDDMPTVGSVGKLYFVATTGLINDNIFDVYIYSEGFIKIYSEISLDLTGYVYKEDLTPITDEEIEEMFSI